LSVEWIPACAGTTAGHDFRQGRAPPSRLRREGEAPAGSRSATSRLLDFFTLSFVFIYILALFPQKSVHSGQLSVLGCATLLRITPPASFPRKRESIRNGSPPLRGRRRFSLPRAGCRSMRSRNDAAERALSAACHGQPWEPWWLGGVKKSDKRVVAALSERRRRRKQKSGGQRPPLQHDSFTPSCPPWGSRNHPPILS